MTVRIAKDGNHFMVPQPVDGLIWEGSIHRGIAAVEYQIERLAEVIPDRLQGRKICVDI